MTSPELIKTIVDFCQANYNEANILKYSRYFKGEYNAYGISAPVIHSKVKELLKTDGINFEVVSEAMETLIASPKSEEVTIGLLLIGGFGKQYTKSYLDVISDWYHKGIQNWAHADTLGMLVLPYFFKYNILSHSDFIPWIKSKHKFQRRSVPVSFIKLLKMKKTQDFSLVFQIIEPLMLDPEREVHQGVGWFLREAWKLNAGVTESFLLKWKDSAPRLVIQYATEKMTKDDKLKYKKLKIS